MKVFDKLFLFFIFGLKICFAVTQNSIIGRTRGKVGGVVFSKWRGLNTLRSKPESVKNPKSPGQLFQRKKLTLLVELYRKIALVVKVGYFEDALEKSAYNAWLQENILKAISGTTESDVAIDYDKLSISKGSVGPTPIASFLASTGTNIVSFGWTSSFVPVGGSSMDIVIAMVFNKTTGELGVLFQSDQYRALGGVGVALPSPPSANDVVYGYLAFKSATSGKTSNSVMINTSVTLSDEKVKGKK